MTIRRALATLVQHSQIRQNDYHILREIVYAYMGFIVDRLQQSDYEFKPQEGNRQKPRFIFCDSS